MLNIVKHTNMQKESHRCLEVRNSHVKKKTRGKVFLIFNFFHKVLAA